MRAFTSTDLYAPTKVTAPSQISRSVLPSSIELEEETRVLLRKRLLVCGIVTMIVAFCILLLALGGSEGALHGASKSVGIALYGFLFLQAIIGVIVSWRNPQISMRSLRQWELFCFGSALLLLSTMQVEALVSYSPESPDPRYARVAAQRTSVVSNFPIDFAIMYYGLLIPNTRRRSLAIVTAMGAVPLLGVSLAAILNPTLREFTPFLLAMTFLGALMAGAAAVFGAARINTLQRQVQEARREAKQFGPYVFKRLLGKGGMGEVYLAEHKLLKRPCAVKLIRPEFSADPQSVARFAREVQAVTGLNHLHTVRVYDYGQAEDGSFYYVMEYLEGHSLDELVRNEGPLAPGRVVYLLRQVCGALAEAHAAGLVHRDLKPANLFIATLGGQPDVAKLLDFGLVQDLGAIDDTGRLTRTGVIVGTPTYMSPEQAAGERMMDGRGDLYSLGAVGFFALTGRPPFTALSVGKLLSAHLTQTPPRADEVQSDVPADLADVIERCLEKAPADRFQSVPEMEAALAACACAAQYTPAVVRG